MSINTINNTGLVPELSRLEQRIRQLERLLGGQPIGTARIADAAITNAKVNDLSVDKLTTGTLAVTVTITIRNDGDTADQGLIGYDAGGF